MTPFKKKITENNFRKLEQKFLYRPKDIGYVSSLIIITGLAHNFNVTYCLGGKIYSCILSGNS